MKIFHWSKETAKSKLITSLCMLVIILGLYVTCYMLFFRTASVDITGNVTLQYHGENGTAYVKALNDKANYNQRIQEFMDAVQYKVTPETDLSNGDILELIATYDEELATRYHIQPINTVRDIEVSNLPERLPDIDMIPATFLTSLTTRSEEYLKKNREQILSEDFTVFYITSQPKFVSSQKLYRMFLSSNDTRQKDKIIDIYAIKAKGEVNTSTEAEVLEEQERTIYYMITYNEINTAFTITEENIYGEKIIVSVDRNLQDEAVFQDYMQEKYQDRYTLMHLKDELPAKES